MTYSPKKHGRTSRANPATTALSQEWVMADQLNEAWPGPGEWVPRDAVFIREDILPRDRGNLVDYQRVREYAEAFRNLPPIQVQRGTFVLIDGAHRLHAAYENAATSLHVCIEELDVPDEDLREAAFRANAGHGRPLAPAERVKHLRYLIEKHGRDWSDSHYGQEAGVSRGTVIEHRRRVEQSLGTAEYVERDGRLKSPPVQIEHSPHVDYARVRGFDPGADDVPWEDDETAAPVLQAAPEGRAGRETGLTEAQPGPTAADAPVLDRAIHDGIAHMTADVRKLADLCASGDRAAAFDLACDMEERMSAIARAVGRWAP